MRKVHEALTPYIEADHGRTVDAMPVLAQLLQGKPLGEEFWTVEKRDTATHVWRPIMPNSLHAGDVVRIKHDAYTGARAAVNGRTGRVAAIRGGIIVTYDDSPGLGMGDRHMPDKLERQLPIRRTSKERRT